MLIAALKSVQEAADGAEEGNHTQLAGGAHEKRKLQLCHSPACEHFPAVNIHRQRVVLEAKGVLSVGRVPEGA